MSGAIDKSWAASALAGIPLERLPEMPWSPPREEDFARLRAALKAQTLPPEYCSFITEYGGCIFGDEDAVVRVTLEEPSPWGR